MELEPSTAPSPAVVSSPSIGSAERNSSQALQNWYEGVFRSARDRYRVSVDYLCITWTWTTDGAGRWEPAFRIGVGDRLTREGDRAFIAELRSLGVSDEELHEHGFLGADESAGGPLRFPCSVVVQEGVTLFVPEDEEVARACIAPSGVSPFAILFRYGAGLGVVASQSLPRGTDGLPAPREWNWAPDMWGEGKALVLPGRRIPSWVGRGVKEPAPSLPQVALQAALSHPYASDALMTQYHHPRMPHRLRTASLAQLPRGYLPRLWLFIGDVDDPVAKRHRTPARPDWLEEEHSKIERLLQVHPGLFLYETKGGYRIVGRLPSPRLPDAEWKRFYLGCLQYLRDMFGILADPQCQDWCHLFRVPHGTREKPAGPERRATYGDAANVGIWAFEPDLTLPLDLPVSSPRSRRGIGPERQIEFVEELPEELEPHVPAFAAALRATPEDCNWHRLHLTLAVALDRRIDAAAIPAFCRAIAFAADDENAEARFGDAADSLRRYGEGYPVTGYPTLKEEYPTVAAALDAIFPRGCDGIARLQWEIDHAPVPGGSVSATEASTAVLRELRQAQRGQGLVVVKTTPGAGKTQAAARLAVERARRDELTTLAVPRHDKAREVVTAIREMRGEVRYLVGPLSVQHADGTPVCQVYEQAKPLADAGYNIREQFCRECPCRTGCPGAEGIVGNREALITVGVHAMLPKLAETAGPGLLVIDESPSWEESFTFVAGDATLTERHLKSDTFAADFAEAALPALRAFVENRELTGAEAEAWGAACRELQDSGRTPPLEPEIVPGLTPVRAREVQTAAKVLQAMMRLHGGVDESTHQGTYADGIRGIQPEFAAALRRSAPTVLLDATPNTRLLEHLLGRPVLPRELHVRDSAPITHEVIYCPTATRTNWTPPGRSVNVEAVTKALAPVLARAAGQSLCLVTFKRVAELLRQADGPFAQLLAAHAASGGQLIVYHYGACRGLNAAAGVDWLITAGDPRPNLEDEYAYAHLLGLDERELGEYIRQKARDELEQAHGRQRSCRMDKPGQQVHIGSLLPGGWGRDTRLRQIETGRPATQAAMSAEEFKAARAALGMSQTEFGKLIGKSKLTVLRYEQGKQAVPPEVADRIAARSSARKVS